MALIEEKNRLWFCLVCPDQRCDRCVNVAAVARNGSRHDRNGTATIATPLRDRTGPGIDNIMVPLQFSRDQEF
jgi:hypothetical protein